MACEALEIGRVDVRSVNVQLIDSWLSLLVSFLPHTIQRRFRYEPVENGTHYFSESELGFCA